MKRVSRVTRGVVPVTPFNELEPLEESSSESIQKETEDILDGMVLIQERLINLSVQAYSIRESEILIDITNLIFQQGKLSLKLQKISRRLEAACRRRGDDSPATADLSAAKSRAVFADPAPTTTESRPKFIKEGNKLVKIGLSEKKKKGRYFQRCDLLDVICLANRLAEAGAGRHPVKIKKIQPIKLGDNRVMTNYQTYAALDWLKAEGLLQKQGGDGYTLMFTGPIAEQIDERFRQLPGQG